MKRILYFIPAIIFCLLYGIAAVIWSLEPSAYIFFALLVASGIILYKNKWWGCIFGIAPALWLMILDLSITGPKLIPQWPLGLIFSIYFIICGFISYKKRS